MMDEMNLQLLEEQEQGIRQLESDISDVNQIFKELGAMVHEQGEVIDSIEAHVEKTEVFVSEGNTQLRQASTYQMGRRHNFCAVVHYRVLLLVQVIRLSTNYTNGLGIRKVEFRGSEPAFAWRESGKTFRKKTTVHPTEIRTSISPSSVVSLNMTGALANYATEVGNLKKLCYTFSHSLMSSDIMKPRSGYSALKIDFLQEAAITPLSSGSNVKVLEEGAEGRRGSGIVLGTLEGTGLGSDEVWASQNSSFDERTSSIMIFSLGTL
ncbi:unnamed protein product, partial [Timema podura]|nr:unnamed protein product [Timema podura]